MDAWRQDVRFAWRRLIRSPGFAAAAILTLALGIGANAIVCGFLNAMILRPLPVSHPEELVFLNSGANGTGSNFSHPNYRDPDWIQPRGCGDRLVRSSLPRLRPCARQ
jgi:hypothetical protein